MENLPPFLKSSIPSVPFKALNFSSRSILWNNLDFKQALQSKNGNLRDYRGLGELMGFDYNTIKIFERKDSPTQLILEAWESRSDATIQKLLEILEEMERYDIIKELVPSLEKAVEVYTDNQKLQEIPLQDPEVSSCPLRSQSERESNAVTVDDVKSGECTYYDAYVAYADEDSHFVFELARILESPEVGLKLFIRGRDLLAGFTEHDTNIMLIKERCRKMLIILSPNFLISPSCEFQASFAAALAIDEQRRLMIPIVYASCEIPLILKYVHKIDFTKPDVQEWIWGKLISSLLPEGKTSMFTLSNHKLPLQTSSFPNAAPLPTVKTNPMVTYPPSTRMIQQNSCTPVSVPVSVEPISEVPVKPSTKPSSKKWTFPWSSHSKGRSNSESNHSASYPSGATSGFHSQSGNNFENLDCSEPDCSSDTRV